MNPFRSVRTLLLSLLLAGTGFAAPAVSFDNLSAALRKVLPAGQKVYKTRVELTKAQAAMLNRFGEGDFLDEDPIDIYYTKDAAGNVTGRAVQVLEILKRWKASHTWVIGIGPDGNLTGVAMMSLPDQYGPPMATAGFLKQFSGKPAAQLALGKHFDAISGSTESCHLLACSVRRAAWLVSTTPLK